MLNYALILIVVVLLFISFKNKEGLAAGEKAINSGAEPITEAIALTIDKQTPQYKSFAATIQQQCAYYDSGNNINYAINHFSNDSSFTNKITNCHNRFKKNPNALNSCYASQLKEYTPPNNEDNIADYIAPCINSIVTTNNVTNFAPMPILDGAIKDAIPINQINNPNPVKRRGWDSVSYILTQNCSPYHSLNEINDAYNFGKKIAIDKLGGPGDCVNATIESI